MATGGSALRSYSSCNSTFTVAHAEPPSENTILECRVCNEIFRFQGDKVPRLLMCGHTVCHQCLTRLPVFGQSLLCPFDRQSTNMGDSGVWGLKKNFALLELLEKIQYSGNVHSVIFTSELLDREKRHAVPCDENETHVAVLFCTVCSTNLCVDCSEVTHATRTLIKHKRVPLSEKPKENPKCLYHPMHLVEFACLENACRTSPMMCYICKDYGRHVRHKVQGRTCPYYHGKKTWSLEKTSLPNYGQLRYVMYDCNGPLWHALLETEAENVRVSIVSATQHIKVFGEEVAETAKKIGGVIEAMEGGTQVLDGPDGELITQAIPGTAELTRNKIKAYFFDLRENLNQQEIAALTTVDAHIREHLCMLKQQQEDMLNLLSQISSVCHRCEVTLQQDDAKVLLAKQEVKLLLDTIQKQQQHFADLPDQLPLDPAIPIVFTKDNRVHIGPKIEMRVLTLGLDDSGKTSLLFKMKQNEFIQTIPTLGFNVETVEYKNVKFTIWDVGGQQKLRPLWKHYHLNTQAVIFVVDSSNKDRLQEACRELAKLVQEKGLKDASLLIFANKQDITPCASIEEITEQFGLFKLCCNQSWHIQACDAKSGTGLQDGLEWLSRQMVAAGAPELA